MGKDFRIETSLTTHPKAVKLIRRCGYEGFFSLISLWSWATLERPEGDLTGMDAEDIEIAANWDGDDGKLVEALEGKFLDGNKDSGWSLHDWAEHNPWAYAAVERGDKSRLSRMAKTHPEIYENLKGRGSTGVSRKEYTSLTTGQRIVNDSLTTGNDPLTNVNDPVTPAPSPSPAPAPAPTPVVKKKPSLSKVTPLDEFDANFFFGIAWQSFPRKEGKKAAFRCYNATVHSEVGHNLIMQAIENYKIHIEQNKVELKYIKQGSTFFNNWQDEEWQSPRAASKKYGGRAIL